MAVLHNRVSQAELKKRLYEETEHRITVSFYHYFFIEDPKQFRDELYKGLNEIRVFGRIYIAHEGINAQVSIPETNFEAFKTFLYSISSLNGLRLNIAVDNDGKSFWVLKIKVREKIVADGISDPAFDMANRGKYVNADEFNKLTDDPNTIVVDMRNHYEYEVGHFENAVEVPSDTFRQQLPMAAEMFDENKDKNIIMYCTGGIRCEKASAYMLHRGFKNVFHLEGRHYSLRQYGERTKPAEQISMERTLCSTTGWESVSPMRSLQNATSVANLPIHIPIVKMKDATCCLYNAKPVQKNMQAVAARNVMMLFNYLKKNRKNSGRELIKAEWYSISQKKDSGPDSKKTKQI